MTNVLHFLAAALLTVAPQLARAQAVYGEIPLTLTDGYLLVETTLADGGPACLAIDLAASTTVVTRSFIGDGVSFQPVPAGSTIAATYNGALAGMHTMERFSLGGIDIGSLSVAVAESLPSIDGLPCAGLIGLDVLQRAEVVVLRYGNRPALMLKRAGRQPSGEYVDVPFTVSGGGLWMNGEINSTAISFLIDSGCPHTLMSPATLRQVRGAASSGSERQLTTLDGTALTLRDAKVKSFRLGGRAFDDVPFCVAESASSNTPVAEQGRGVLGNSFLSTLAQLELDFKGKSARLVMQ